MAVDIGAEAINRASIQGTDTTNVNKDHPATIAGTITSIDIWANTDITGLKVGTFYTTNGNTLKCRASATIAGTITAGSKVTKVVSIAVEIGDYIAYFCTGGTIERDTVGYAGLWTAYEDYMTPGDEAVYEFRAGDAVSLGGYIGVAVAGRSFGFIIG